MTTHQEAMEMLEKTSRTFYLPIVRLPKGLQEAVTSGYLCLRAIDEIEDHPGLDTQVKVKLLQSISLILQAQTSVGKFAFEELENLFQEYQDVIPEVSQRIGEWACYAPQFIAPRIWEATAAMADRMAHWVLNGWKVVTEADLNRYTYGVAGAVGLMLCDLWGWFEKFQMHRSHAIQFGRGLQAVNILRNHQEDLSRGVDFFPQGWDDQKMFEYARDNLDSLNGSSQSLPKTFVSFVEIPQALAYATLDVMMNGKEKLSRRQVLEIVGGIDQTVRAKQTP
jgi:farnesyl-diphosphate farnesyltransferase